MKLSVVLFEISLNYISISVYCLCKPKLRQTGPLMFLPARLRYCSETVLHCLSTKCLVWQNTILILTMACLLPLISKLLVLFVSHGSCRLSLTEPNSFQAHQLFSTCCLQGTPWEITTMNAVRRQEIHIYKPIFFKVVLVSWWGQWMVEIDWNAVTESECFAKLPIHFDTRTMHNHKRHFGT